MFFKFISTLLVITTTLTWSVPIYAEGELPSGYVPVVGSSEYSVSPDGLVGNLTAHDNVTIGNWEIFNIGAPNTFNALLPGADSAHLSRVVGTDPSSIFGALNVPQGKFFLVNPNGIFFSSTSQVNAAGLVASTLNVTNEDFLNKNFKFSEASSGAAAVINAGLMNIGLGGVALLGGAVQNLGLIQARESSVAMASGKEMTLSFDNSGLIHVAVDKAVAENVVGVDGAAIVDGVSNAGIIRADGGKVLMTTEAVKGVFDHLVNQEGVIEANSTVVRNGVVELSSNFSEGVVASSGTISAQGLEAGLTGGTIKISGEKVGIFDGEINASGDAGGGTVLIGGDYQGKGALRNADYTYVGPDAVVKADALTAGDGGKAIFWSDKITRFNGTVSAKGGEVSGDGGFVEISSHDNLVYRGLAYLGATDGKAGTILFDPRDITISNGPDANTTGFTAGTDNTEAFADDTPSSNTDSTFDVDNPGGSFIGVGNGATIELQANRNLSVTSAFNVGTATGNSNVNLILRANNDMNINAPITLTGTGSLTLSADNNLNNNGVFTSAAAGDITTSTGSVTISGADGMSLAGTITTAGGNVSITNRDTGGGGGEDVTISAAISTSGGKVTISANDDVILSGAAADVTTGGGTYTVNANSDGDANGTYTQNNAGSAVSTTTGAVSITATGLSLTGTIAAGSGNVTLKTAATANSIGVGTTAGTTMDISDAELDNITTTGTIEIGDTANTGGIVVGGAQALTQGAKNFELITAGTLTTQTNTFTTTGDVAFTADNMTLGIGLNANNVTLQPAAVARTIAVNDATGSLSLTDAELDFITATGTLTVGSAAAGAISIGSAGTLTQSNSIEFTSGGNVTLNGGITTTNGGTVTVTNAGTLNVNAGADMNLDGAFLQDGAGAFNLSADITTTNDNIQFNAVTLGDDVTLGAGTASILAMQSVTAGANNLTLTADEIDLLGGDGTVSGSGDLVLQPFTPGLLIDIGGAGNTAALDLTASDGGALVDGFNSITVGRADGTGGINFSSAISFSDPMRFLSPLGGEINVFFALRGEDNATLFFDGSGATTNLYDNIVTTGLLIEISDSVRLFADVLLDTTDGGGFAGDDIHILGTIDADAAANNRSLTLTAGTSGSVLLDDAVGSQEALQNFEVTSADDVDLNGTVDTQAAISIHDANAVNIKANADLTAGTSLTINNVTTVDLADNVDLTAQNGLLDVATGVGTINLSGDATTNIIDGNGDALVDLAAVTATNDVNLTVNSEGDLNSVSVDINNGNLDVNVDNDDDGAQAGTFGSITAGDLSVRGYNAASGDETFTFNGAINVSGGLTLGGVGILTLNNDVMAGTFLRIEDVAVRVELGSDVDLTALNGDLSVFDNVTLIQLNGADGTTDILNSLGDFALTLGPVSSLNNANLTICSDGDVVLDDLDTNDGSLLIKVDQDDDSVGANFGSFALLSSGDLTVNGTSGDDTFTFNDAVTTTVDGISLDGNGDVSFESTVDSAGDLTQTNGGGTTLFKDAVTTDGDVDITTDAITFSGAGHMIIGAGGGLAKLKANTGSITSGGAVADVTAHSLVADAAQGGVGGPATADWLQSRVDLLEAVGGLGGVHLLNDGALKIGGISALTGVFAGGGGVGIHAKSPITVDEEVTDDAGGDVELAALGATAADDLTLNANVTASGGDGNIELVAGDTVSIAGGVTVQAANGGNVTIVSGEDLTDDLFNQDGNADGDVQMILGSTVASDDGDVSLDAARNIDVSTVTANADLDGDAGDVTMIARQGAINGSSDDADADIIGNNIGLTASAGGIGTSTVLDVSAATALNADTTNDNSNIFIDSIGNLPLGLADAGSGDIDLDSTGNITDANGGALNTNSDDLDLTAATGIGVGDALEVIATTLTANTILGDIIIDLDPASAGPTTILNARVTGGIGNIDISQLASFTLFVNGVSTVAGSVHVDSIVDLFINGPLVFSGGNLGLTLCADSDNNGTGDLTIGAAATVNGDIGPVTLCGVNINIIGSIISGGDVTINVLGDLFLGVISAHSFNIFAGGNIIDTNGDTGNLFGEVTSSLGAGGFIGRFFDTIDILLQSGDLLLFAGGQSDGVSANLHAGIPGQLIITNTPPGLVILNNIAVGGATLPLLSIGLATVFNTIAFQPDLSAFQRPLGLLAGVIDSSRVSQPLVIVDPEQEQRLSRRRVPTVVPVVEVVPPVVPVPTPELPPAVELPVLAPELAPRPTPQPTPTGLQLPFELQPQQQQPVLTPPLSGPRLFQQSVEEQAIEEKPKTQDSEQGRTDKMREWWQARFSAGKPAGQPLVTPPPFGGGKLFQHEVEETPRAEDDTQ